MKKTIPVLLLFIVFILCACGHDTDPTETLASEETSVSAVSSVQPKVSKPVVVFNLAAFPFGSTDDNIQYMMESTGLPVKSFDEKIETVDFGDEKFKYYLLNYVLSTDDVQLQVQYKDVILDINYVGDVALEFAMGEDDTNKLEAFYLHGYVDQKFSDKQDIKDFLRGPYESLGILDNTDLKYYEKYERYSAEGKIDKINITMSADINSKVDVGANNY